MRARQPSQQMRPDESPSPKGNDGSAIPHAPHPAAIAPRSAVKIIRLILFKIVLKLYRYSLTAAFGFHAIRRQVAHMEDCPAAIVSAMQIP
jgi:hypothetical protein